jgi:hypothetical protein
MKEWIEQNKPAAFLAAFTIFIGAFMAVASGCDLEQMVDVEVPTAVRIAIEPNRQPGDPPREYSLADADRIVADWESFVRTGTSQLEAALEYSRERHARLASVVDMGVAAVNEVAPAIPGGAFLIGGLSLLTGIFLKRPGEDKRVAQEKEDSYNAGIELGKSIVKEIKKE